MTRFFNDMNPVVSFKRKENADVAQLKVEVAALAQRQDRASLTQDINNNQLQTALAEIEKRLDQTRLQIRYLWIASILLALLLVLTVVVPV